MSFVGRNNTTVLKFFIDNPGRMFSKKDVYVSLSMNKNTCHWAMVDLLIQDMICEKKGRPNLYYLNKRLGGLC